MSRDKVMLMYSESLSSTHNLALLSISEKLYDHSTKNSSWYRYIGVGAIICCSFLINHGLVSLSMLRFHNRTYYYQEKLKIPKQIPYALKVVVKSFENRVSVSNNWLMI
ncbi:hypothetical protein QL285_017208 [Trifolium repens]|nr:hypothetical protein QL285_017208 [Trifolium repens]